MRTHPFLIATLTAVFTISISACDEPDDPPGPVGCADDDCEDKMDEMAGDESADEGDDPSGAADTAPPAGEGGGGGVPAECQALCACVEGLGGNLGACGQSCSADMGDEDVNDRAQCEEGLAEVGFSDCAVECEGLPDGT